MSVSTFKPLVKSRRPTTITDAPYLGLGEVGNLFRCVHYAQCSPNRLRHEVQYVFHELAFTSLLNTLQHLSLYQSQVGSSFSPIRPPAHVLRYPSSFIMIRRDTSSLDPSLFRPSNITIMSSFRVAPLRCAAAPSSSQPGMLVLVLRD